MTIPWNKVRDALAAHPDKRLGVGQLYDGELYCALGAVTGATRAGDLNAALGLKFGLPDDEGFLLGSELWKRNDAFYDTSIYEEPEQRYVRMLAWLTEKAEET